MIELLPILPAPRLKKKQKAMTASSTLQRQNFPEKSSCSIVQELWKMQLEEWRMNVDNFRPFDDAIRDTRGFWIKIVEVVNVER